MANTNITKLTVVRHGETLWNQQLKIQGHLNSNLSELGIRQAQAIANALVGNQFDALYASDLGRAVQTAEIIAQRLNLKVVTDVRLRERCYGIVQGLTHDEFQQELPEQYALYLSGNTEFIIPGGENARQFFDRVLSCAHEIAERHSRQHVAIVTHGGVLDTFIRKTFDLPLGASRRYSLFNSSINSFTVSDSKWKLESWGNILHLRSVGITEQQL